MTLGCDPLVSTFDCDNDGLPDLWEQQYLGNIAGLPTDDNDGDTITNLEEYSSGTDPSDKTSLPAYMWITPLLMVGS
jgi:hypothetical protein